MIDRPVACGVAALVTLAAPPALTCSSCGCTLTSDALSQGIGSKPGTTIIRIKAVSALSIVNLSHAPPRCATTHLLQKV
jgi:hypothetical protein